MKPAWPSQILIGDEQLPRDGTVCPPLQDVAFVWPFTAASPQTHNLSIFPDPHLTRLNEARRGTGDIRSNDRGKIKALFVMRIAQVNIQLPTELLNQLPRDILSQQVGRVLGPLSFPYRMDLSAA